MTINKRRYFNPYEALTYFIVWALVILMSVIKVDKNGLGCHTWSEMNDLWIELAPFFVVFLIHNLIVIPAFLFKRKFSAYIVSVIFLLVGYFGAAYIIHKSYKEKFDKEFMETRSQMERERYHKGKLHRMWEEKDDRLEQPGTMMPPDEIHDKKVLDKMRKGGPIRWIGPLETRMLIAFLMLGANLAIHLLFRSKRDEELMKAMEREHLKNELTYLKYQINPHFFMNTLNNIHALIDIDANQAKDSIIILSRLMRYTLYDGASEHVQLNKDIEFIRHYVNLMRLRYDDSIEIILDLPIDVPNMEIAPLIFVTFIENAFKHGISYHQKSYIHVDMDVDDEKKALHFYCENSKVEEQKPPTPQHPQHSESGIGLDNVKKRLQLLYPDTHKLTINDEKDKFVVDLTINTKL